MGQFSITTATFQPWEARSDSLFHSLEEEAAGEHPSCREHLQSLYRVNCGIPSIAKGKLHMNLYWSTTHVLKFFAIGLFDSIWPKESRR
jgi:hypothetical protein